MTKKKKPLPSEKPRCEHNRLLDGACPECHEALVKVLASIADEAGIWARDVPRFPHLLRDRVPLAKATGAVCKQADDHNARELAALIARYGANRKPTETPYVDAPTVFGRSVEAVLHWMGQDGWSNIEAMRCLDNLDIDVSGETVRREMTAGRKGAAAAKLTATEREKLYELGGCKF